MNHEFYNYRFEKFADTRPKLTIIRGIVGSGKTTLAKHISENSLTVIEHFEADMFEGLYYHNEDGFTFFDGTKIKQAHEWCFDNVKRCLLKNHDVIVSNTFTQKWEMQKYIDLAQELMCRLEVIVATGEYKSIHNVPAEVIEKMKDRWEDLA